MNTKKKFGATVGAATLVAAGLLLTPGAAYAAGAGGNITQATITVVDGSNAPLAGETVTVDAVWPDLLQDPALDAAQADVTAAQASVQDWYASKDRPARAASQAAFQTYLSNPTSANSAAWMSANRAEMAETRRSKPPSATVLKPRP